MKVKLPGLVLALAALLWPAPLSAAPAPPSLAPSPYQLTSVGELAQVLGQARQEVIYLTAGVPSQGLANALTALTVPVYVLLPARSLSPVERSLARAPHVQVRVSDRFSGAGGFALIDRQTIVLGPLLTTAPAPSELGTLVAWMPDADSFVRLFRTMWNTAASVR